MAEIVLDTNVLVELSTIVDLDRAAHDLTTASASDPTTAALHARRARARASLALAWWLHQGARTSLSLRDEAIAKVVELSPPGGPGAIVPAFFTYFLKDYVLPRWDMSVAMDVAYDDRALSPNDRDRTLVRLARAERVPLVTNEANPKGAVAKQAAIAPRVLVFTPAAFLADRGLEEAALAGELLDAASPALVAFAAATWPVSAQLVRNARTYYAILKWIVTGSAR